MQIEIIRAVDKPGQCNLALQVIQPHSRVIVVATGRKSPMTNQKFGVQHSVEGRRKHHILATGDIKPIVAILASGDGDCDRCVVGQHRHGNVNGVCGSRHVVEPLPAPTPQKRRLPASWKICPQLSRRPFRSLSFPPSRVNVPLFNTEPLIAPAIHWLPPSTRHSPAPVVWSTPPSRRRSASSRDGLFTRTRPPLTMRKVSALCTLLIVGRSVRTLIVKSPAERSIFRLRRPDRTPALRLPDVATARAPNVY